MIEIYAIPVSLYCAKLRVLLRHKGLEWREIPPPGGYGSDEYKTVVPSGNLPALIDDGFVVGDSEAIAEYLNEKFPDPPMLPADPRARVKIRELSRFHDTRLEPEVRKLFPLIGSGNTDATTPVQQCQAINARLNQLAQLLDSTGTSGESPLSLADCGYPITFAWLDRLNHPFDLDITWPDQVTNYRLHLTRHPAISEELATYTEKLNDWLEQQGR